MHGISEQDDVGAVKNDEHYEPWLSQNEMFLLLCVMAMIMRRLNKTRKLHQPNLQLYVCVSICIFTLAS